MSLINTLAPTFKVPAVVNNSIVPSLSLSELLDGHKALLLVFYPKDFTYICPTELLALQKKLPLFKERGVQVAACSTDTAETHYAWLQTPIAKRGIQGITYPLLADEAKTVSINYEVLGGDWYEDEEESQLHFHGDPVAYRATFLIDAEGIIRYQSVQDLNLGRNIDELLRIVDMWKYTKENPGVCPANWTPGAPTLDPTPQGIETYLQAHNPLQAATSNCCKPKTGTTRQDSTCCAPQKGNSSPSGKCCSPQNKN